MFPEADHFCTTNVETTDKFEYIPSFTMILLHMQLVVEPLDLFTRIIQLWSTGLAWLSLSIA